MLYWDGACRRLDSDLLLPSFLRRSASDLLISGGGVAATCDASQFFAISCVIQEGGLGRADAETKMTPSTPLDWPRGGRRCRYASRLPLIAEGATPVNELISVVQEDGQWVYFCGTQPIFEHAEGDRKAFRMFTAQLCGQGVVKQAHVMRAFGVSRSSLLRSVDTYRRHGIEGFYQQRRVRGAPVMTPEVIQQAEHLLEEGHSKAEAARRLNVAYDTLRKAIDQGRVQMPDCPAERKRDLSHAEMFLTGACCVRFRHWRRTDCFVICKRRFPH